MMSLPPFAQAALLIDLDGTLLDIAPTPSSVIVPPDVPRVLRALRLLLDDALAIVTGRPIEMIDALLGDLPFAVAGEHGAVIRHAPGAPVERPMLPAPPIDWLTEAERLTAEHPGALLELKEHGFSLHYRAVPAASAALCDGLTAMLAKSDEFELLAGIMIWEVRPRGVDKGTAVAALMERPPFHGRLPVFLGDDVTDEDGIRVVTEMGGAGLRVQEVFGDAAGVRAWLAEIAASGTWPVIASAVRGR